MFVYVIFLQSKCISLRVQCTMKRITFIIFIYSNLGLVFVGLASVSAGFNNVVLTNSVNKETLLQLS